MTTTPETEAHGPVDFVLLEFPVEGLTGRASEELVKLVEQGVIRLFDLLVVMKNEDGTVEVLELTDPGGPAAAFSYFDGARTGLLGDDDIAEAIGRASPRDGRRADCLREHLGGTLRGGRSRQRGRAHREHADPCAGRDGSARRPRGPDADAGSRPAPDLTRKT